MPTGVRMQGLYKDKKKHFMRDKIKAVWKKYSFNKKTGEYNEKDILKYEVKNSVEVKGGWDFEVEKSRLWRKQNKFSWIMEEEEVKRTKLQRVGKYKYEECLKCPYLQSCNMASLLVYKTGGSGIEYKKKYKEELEVNLVWCKKKDIWDGWDKTYKIVGERRQHPKIKSVDVNIDTSKVYWLGVEITPYKMELVFEKKFHKYEEIKSMRRKIKANLKNGVDEDLISNISGEYAFGEIEEYWRSRRYSTYRRY